MAKDEKRGQLIPLENLIDSAIAEGTAIMADQHPRFTPEFLAQYLDSKAVSKYATMVAKKMQEYQEEGKDPKKVVEKSYKTLAARVASGRLFTPEGKEIILSQSLREKGRSRFRGGAAREVIKGEEYLDKAMHSFKDLYNLMKSGDYAQRFPELAKAVATIYDLGFLDAASNILYKNGQLEEGQYTALKEAIREKTKRGIGAINQALEGYFSRSLAASIFAIIGIGILASIAMSNSITGNVTGMTKVSVIPALTFGALSLVFGIYLWMNKKGKSQNRITLKN